MSVGGGMCLLGFARSFAVFAFPAFALDFFHASFSVFPWMSSFAVCGRHRFFILLFSSPLPQSPLLPWPIFNSPLAAMRSYRRMLSNRFSRKTREATPPHRTPALLCGRELVVGTPLGNGVAVAFMDRMPGIVFAC